MIDKDKDKDKNKNKDLCRLIIEKSIKNMEGLYKDTGILMQLIEDKMFNEGFKALGDTGVYWRSSSSLANPQLWFPRYIGRIYLKNHKNENEVSRMVGYNIHLAGNYSSFLGEHDLPVSFPVPLIAVSLLKFEKPIKPDSTKRTSLLNILWRSGWNPEENYSKNGGLWQGSHQENFSAINTVTYFVDMLDLTEASDVERIIINPMVQMYKGDEEYVNVNNLPVVR